MVIALPRKRQDRGLRERLDPMFKIIRKFLTSTRDESVVLTLIGQIEGESLEELKRLMGSEVSGDNLVLDMKDVTLVDQSAIRFLARCEADSVTLENCPAYIRDWIAAEKSRNRRR
jgi:hypothetical protein